MFDEHLAPGEGSQPLVEVLQQLAANRFDGAVVAEVSTGKDRSREAKIQRLTRTLEFAKAHTVAPVMQLPANVQNETVLAKAS